MKDLSAAIAAARDALHEHDAYGMPIDEALEAVLALSGSGD